VRAKPPSITAEDFAGSVRPHLELAAALRSAIEVRDQGLAVARAMRLQAARNAWD
jgi:hypothetical protein